MAPVKPRSYEFDAASIAGLRNRLKIKQTKMAELLGVPANTLSRWETGVTKPDADSLAAIYSVATENSLAIDFFKRNAVTKPQPKKPEKRASQPAKATKPKVAKAVVMADMQNLGVASRNVQKFTQYVREAVRSRADGQAPILKAFVAPGQCGDALQQHKWRVWEDAGDWDADMAHQAKSDCGHNPSRTALFLVTKDGDFADLIKDLKGKGVQVYLMAPAGASKKLLDVVDKKHRVPWQN